jgi:hypothetical protein
MTGGSPSISCKSVFGREYKGEEEGEDISINYLLYYNNTKFSRLLWGGAGRGAKELVLK